MKTQQQFYKSDEWERFRRLIIERDTDPKTGFIYCSMCGKPILRKYDLIVDHIQEIDDITCNDATIALNPDNVRCMHFKCHNERHDRFKGGYNGRNGWINHKKKIYIVYGSPCAGKTTYVKEKANENDLVIDIDRIYEMLTINEPYKKPNTIKGTVFDVRDHIYDIVKYRRGKWWDAYIITGGPTVAERKRLKDRVGADELIHIDTDKDTCLLRNNKGVEWERYINEYWERYQEEVPTP